MNPRYYRVRILRDIAHACLVPQLLVLGILYLTHWSPAPLLRTLLHLIAIPVVGASKVWYSSYNNARIAGRTTFMCSEPLYFNQLTVCHLFSISWSRPCAMCTR